MLIRAANLMILLINIQRRSQKNLSPSLLPGALLLTLYNLYEENSQYFKITSNLVDYVNYYLYFGYDIKYNQTIKEWQNRQ